MASPEDRCLVCLEQGTEERPIEILACKPLGCSNVLCQPCVAENWKYPRYGRCLICNRGKVGDDPGNWLDAIHGPLINFSFCGVLFLVFIVAFYLPIVRGTAGVGPIEVLSIPGDVFNWIVRTVNHVISEIIGIPIQPSRPLLSEEIIVDRERKMAEYRQQLETRMKERRAEIERDLRMSMERMSKDLSDLRSGLNKVGATLSKFMEVFS